MSRDKSSLLPNTMPSPINIVLGGAGIGLLLAAAGFAFLRSQRNAGSGIVDRVGPTRIGIPKPNFKGKWALNAAIRLIEHDGSRKVLLGVLKTMAKRAK